MKNKMDTTIIIPTLNEEGNIEELISRLKGYKVIVADDGSRDKTQEIARRISRKNRNVTLIDRSKEKIKGLTASVVDGVKKADTEFLIIMDADLQHPPEKVREIAEVLKKYPVVIATRRKIRVKWGLKRRTISAIATTMAKLRLLTNGIYCKDPVSGFFGARTRLFQDILRRNERRFVKQGYKVSVDLLKCLPFGTRIGQVYYDFGERKAGESKIGKRQIGCFIKSLVT